MKQHTNKTTQSNRVSVMLTGTILALIVTLILTALATTLIQTGTVLITQKSWLIYATIFISVLFGSAIVKGRGGELISIAGLAGCYLVILMCVNIILFQGEFEDVFKHAIVIVSGSAIVCIPFARKGKKPYKYRKK